jgi:hypothetical protein
MDAGNQRTDAGGAMEVQLNLGTVAGRAGSPLPAAIAKPRVLICHDGAHGGTRPTCLKITVNCYRPLKLHKNAFQADTSS